jgi:hypothetical protein
MRWELLEECYHHEALRKSTLGHARARIWRRVVTRWSNLRKGRAKVGAKNALFRVFRFACYPTHPHLCARMGNSIARLVSPLKVYVVFWFFFCFFQLASPFPTTKLVFFWRRARKRREKSRQIHLLFDHMEPFYEIFEG